MWTTVCLLEKTRCADFSIANAPRKCLEKPAKRKPAEMVSNRSGRFLTLNGIGGVHQCFGRHHLL
jgi:hypothetical protein